MQQLDKLDRDLLRELLKNSRKSYREISKTLGVTTNTVISRANKLIKEKIIKSNTLMLNSEKLGFTISAIIEVKFNKGRLLETEEEISKMYNVYGVYDVTGEMDSTILARFHDRAELNDFVKKLLKNHAIEKTNTHIILNTIKEDLRVPV